MRILIIGANGIIGKKLTPALTAHHEIISVARINGDISVDISSDISIKNMFQKIHNIDACIRIRTSRPLDNFATLTEQQLYAGFKAKLFAQSAH
jgi:dTDP-4-dehydrorhamnose reductase